MDDIFAGLDQDPRIETTTAAARFTAEPGMLTGEDALTFIRAGRAVFTVRSIKTGTRFTYRVATSEDGRMRFVGVMTSEDNNRFTYIGHVQIGREIFWHGRKSRIGADAPSVKAFTWLWKQLNSGRSLEQAEIWHEGCCGRCGRTLTVPESIQSGFGPECVTKIAA